MGGTIRFIGTFLAGCSLVACGSTEIARGPRGMVNGKPATLDTRIFAGPCLFGDPATEVAFLGALAGAVVPSLVDKSLTVLGNALKAAGEAKAYTVTAETPLQLSKTNLPRCLQVVRGRFYNNPADLPATVQAAAWKPTSRPGDGMPSNVYANPANPPASMLGAGIWLADEPDLFLELPVVVSSDQSAVFVTTRYATYNRPVATGALRGSGEAHAIIVNVSFPTLRADAKASPVAIVNLGHLTPGHEVRYMTPAEAQQLRLVLANQQPVDSPTPTMTLDDSGSTPGGPIGPSIGGPIGGAGAAPAASPFGGMAAPSAPAGTGSTTTVTGADSNVDANRQNSGASTTRAPVVSTFNKLPLSSAWIPLSLTEVPQPVTVRVDIVDTEQPNRFFAFLGDVLIDSKDKVAPVITQEILPAEREKRALAATQANQQLFAAYGTANKDYQTKLEAYQKTPGANSTTRSATLYGLAFDAITAYRNAVVSAQAAGQPAPPDPRIDPNRHSVVQ